MSWDALHRSQRHFLRYPNEHVIRFLSRRPLGTLLDVGCGAGRHSRLALEMGHEVTATDVSPQALERTRMVVGAYNNFRCLEASQTDLPFDDGAYDTVLSIGSVYYGTMPELERSLSEIKRVLKPGGMAFIMTITTDDTRFTLDGETVGYHSRRLTSDETGEAGLTLTFLDNGGIRLLMRQWSDYHLGKSDVRWNGRLDSQWLIEGQR